MARLRRSNALRFCCGRAAARRRGRSRKIPSAAPPGEAESAAVSSKRGLGGAGGPLGHKPATAHCGAHHDRSTYQDEVLDDVLTL